MGGEFLDKLLVDRLAVVDGSERQLLDNVVEAGRPLPAAPLCREGAIVDHEGDAAIVHVRSEAVDRFDHRLVDDLGVAVPALKKHVDLRHHGRDVDAGREGIKRRGVFVPVGADAFSDLPRVGTVDLTNVAGEGWGCVALKLEDDVDDELVDDR